MHSDYDVIVIGGGHAGAEAVWAASRLGAQTALVTMSVDAIGRMSCNPAIGGIGKGQMVREIDAMGGLMGEVIDATGIQFRTLNRSKGPAVQAPRAQADRDLYAAELQRRLVGCRNLTLVEGLVEDVLVSDGKPPRVVGVSLKDGRRLEASAVIITSGTFMCGLMHCGAEQTEGGRHGEASAKGLSRCLIELGFELGRLKTGTPARLHRDTIRYGVLQPQPGDIPPEPFSYMTDSITQPQIDCWVTYTNPTGHDLIRRNLHRAPMYSGQIKCRGVRYCPSIEDKVVRFADKNRHQIFLEPEGYDNERIYCNGLGTSLPREVQEEFIHSIEGLEEAKILQYGYAIEYDFVPTHQTHYTLETKSVAGLYLAGQINGTSGYEEAAGQGLVAGINAVLKLRQEEPLILGRDQAYIGVMIDDLIARPPDEPYRMFTSRAEYRLLLRSDNADDRLTPIGHRLGMVDVDRWRRYQEKYQHVYDLEAILASTRNGNKTLAELLRSPQMSWEEIQSQLPADRADLIPRDASRQVEIRARYAGYIERMKRDIQRMNSMEHRKIPVDLQFVDLQELRFEAREKFDRVRPLTLGQASRISGITPADITVLWLSIEMRHKERRESTALDGCEG